MIRYFADHPVAANLLMGTLLVLGLATLPGMQRETFPQLVNDQVRISMVYPGATAAQVEDAICRRVEDALEAVNDLDEIRCEATEGVGKVVAVMREQARMSRFLDDVNSEIDAINDFPDDVEPPVVVELGRSEDVISVAVTGIRDAAVLKDYAEDLKSRLQRNPLIDAVALSGFSQRHIRIEVAAHRLRQFGVSVSDLADILRRQSVGMPGGRLEGEREDMLLRFDDQRKGVDAFRDLVVLSDEQGAEIRLADIAEIRDVFDRAEDKVLFNGERAALLSVRKNRSTDALNVLDAVHDFVSAERRRVPEGVTLTLTRDRVSLISDRLYLLITNSAQGLVLVFLVLWLFFSLRFSFWVAMGLPVSFLGALFVIAQLGLTLNMISVVGLLIAVGLLMDDAIVIAENIAARLNRGDEPLQAAINGAREVFPGILSSFATTALIFGSVAFISGTLGQILRVMPIVLIVVLAVSLLEAFLILPHHLGHSLAHARKREPGRLRQRFETGFNRFRDRYFHALLARALASPYLTIGIIVMLVLCSVALVAGGGIGFRGFPDVDGDIVEARILLPQGTPLGRTEQVVRQVTEALDEVNAHFAPRQPDGRDLVTSVAVIFNTNPDAYESGPHVAQVSADLLSAEIRDAGIDAVLDRWRQSTGDIADVIRIKYTEPSLGPAGRAVDIRLQGADLTQLKQASIDLQRWMSGYVGVQDLGDDLRPGKREYRLRLKAGAGTLGLDAREVAGQVSSAFQGVTIDEFPLGAESYEVNLRLLAADRAHTTDLDDLRLVTPRGSLVPLRAVADIEEDRGWARIYRVNGRRTVTVQGDVDADRANAQAIVNDAEAEFLSTLGERYPGVSHAIEGESKESGKTRGSIVGNMLLGLLGVYVLLAFQFRSYLLPVAVMTVIPTGFIGVVWGHYLLGLDLSLPSIMGAASLAGIVVNDSILIVQFIARARRGGADAVQAALQAGVDRFRPVFLTSLTTVAGLTPLLLEKSLQAQVLIPLAASLAFGLAAATVCALFLVPAFLLRAERPVPGAAGTRYRRGSARRLIHRHDPVSGSDRPALSSAVPAHRRSAGVAGSRCWR